MFFSSKMASNQQNRSIKCFISRNFKLLMFVAISLFIGSNVFSASPFTDYFDYYDIGNLAGQGNWATTTQDFYAQTTTTNWHSSDISVYWTSSENSSIKKTGSEITIGQWSFWLMVNTDATSGSDNEWGVVLLSGDSPSTSYLRIECYEEDCSLTSETARIQYSTAGMKMPLCDIPTNEWVNFQAGWDSSNETTRWKCGDNAWTTWDTRGAFDYISTFELRGSNETGKVKINLDSIGATPYPVCELGQCKFCEVYPTCIDAGCFWYYSIYFQKHYCVEPFIPEDDECGSFYKCQYCLNQTTCEQQLNCQWTDIGFGVKCYMIEPTIPIPQVEWETPTLDDCNVLSGTEKWLCEIKNFIAGIFMPSQEKLEEIYQTIGAFKEKFPFNYMGSLDIFFENIAESLDEEKSIPIKILGHESDVDFTFWNNTTTIGGEEETFKNVWFDFTTAIVLIGWFVWLISWIKRFF